MSVKVNSTLPVRLKTSTLRMLRANGRIRSQRSHRSRLRNNSMTPFFLEGYHRSGLPNRNRLSFVISSAPEPSQADRQSTRSSATITRLETHLTAQQWGAQQISHKLKSNGQQYPRLQVHTDKCFSMTGRTPSVAVQRHTSTVFIGWYRRSLSLHNFNRSDICVSPLLVIGYIFRH
jgi:hypothetical protein